MLFHPKPTERSDLQRGMGSLPVVAVRRDIEWYSIQNNGAKRSSRRNTGILPVLCSPMTGPAAS